MSILEELAVEPFPHSPARVREVLTRAGYDRKKAASKLSVDPESLWEFVNGPVYMRYMRAEAHVALLKMLECSAVETPKNIAVLCEIRDTSDKDRERIAAVKALEEIFSDYRLPEAPADSPESASDEERKRAAFERISTALRNAGPPNIGEVNRV